MDREKNEIKEKELTDVDNNVVIAGGGKQEKTEEGIMRINGNGNNAIK